MTTDLNELYKMKRRGGGTSVDLTDLPGYQTRGRDFSPGKTSADLADLPGYRKQVTARATPARLPRRKTKTRSKHRTRTVYIREGGQRGGGVTSPGLGSGAEIPAGGLIGQGKGVLDMLRSKGKRTGRSKLPRVKSKKDLERLKTEAKFTERFDRAYDIDEYGRAVKKPKGVVGKLKKRLGI